MSSQELCKACVLLEGLNRGNPELGVRSESRAAKQARRAQLAEAVEGESPGKGVGRIIPMWNRPEKDVTKEEKLEGERKVSVGRETAVRG